MLAFYRAANWALTPAIDLYLARRRARGKEDAERFPERLGHAGRARPSGPLIWLHAASVGESLSLLALVERLRARGIGVLLTTGTVTSAKLMSERLPAGAIHQYVPIDRLSAVRRFLDHWRPDLALWAESEFWPNLVSETARRDVPLVLINGRVSPSSMRGWSRFPGLIRELLGGFVLCLAQTEADAERLRALGAPDVETPGNLKFASAPLPDDAEARAALDRAIGNRPRWLFASTHAGEEALAWRVHQRLADEIPDLLTLLVPRHPDRGPNIASELEALGAGAALRSRGDMPSTESAVYIADTMGDLGLFFRLADVVVMGKSFVGRGGQNPIEPARLGRAVLFGPEMQNFEEVASRLAASGGGIEVEDEHGLATTLAHLLGDAEARAEVAHAAERFAAAEAGVLDRVEAALAPHLARLVGPDR
jgi:3-deoxy-D-manno-octulosonic-acid transferase